MSGACSRIVVVGGSAGGVEAVSRIVSALPENLAAAVFVVLHLNASLPSVLPSVLRRKTALRVQAARDGLEIRCGTVYVGTPDRHLLIDNGFIRLGRGARENNFRPAVDPLFRTAAAAYGAQVIAILLTGNLDDGSAGLLAIKRRGGTAIVQQPADALYPSMPASALEILGSNADHVASAEEIGPLLVELVGTGATAATIQGGRPVPYDVALGEEEPVLRNESGERHPRPTHFGCPACGGVLQESTDGELNHYRCRVGHAFSEEALLAAQTETLETALWTALRALEEAAESAASLSNRMQRRGHARLAERFARQADDAARRASIVRQALTYNQADEDRIASTG